MGFLIDDVSCPDASTVLHVARHSFQQFRHFSYALVRPLYLQAKLGGTSVPGESCVQCGAMPIQEVALGQCAQLQCSADPQAEDRRMSESLISFWRVCGVSLVFAKACPDKAQSVQLPWLSPRHASMRGGGSACAIVCAPCPRVQEGVF